MTEKNTLYTIEDISDNRSVLPDGSLECRNVPIARSGNLEYNIKEPLLHGLPLDKIKKDDRGNIVVYRAPSELFNPDTIRSFESKPLTLQHPPTDTGMVDPRVYRMVVCGVVRNVRQEGNLLVADLVINDQNTIDKVESGQCKQLSIGFYYSLELDPETGQLCQKNIIGNHVAIVEEGRAGDICTIIDSKPNEVQMAEDTISKAEFDALKRDYETLRKEHEELAKQNTEILARIGGAKGKDAKGRDESAEKRHEDEVRGGEKANAELEGEHREEKRMRADDRKGRDSDDRLDHGSIADRLDKQDDILEAIARVLKIDIHPDKDKEISKQVDRKGRDARARDEDETERHRDDVRGGEVAEGEYREKHDEGERFDDDGRMTDSKGKDAKGCDDDDAEEEEAIQLTLDEAEELDPTEINVAIDRAFNKLAQDAAFVGHQIVPEMSVNFAYDSANKVRAQRGTLEWYRQAVVNKARQNSAYSGIIARATDSKPISDFKRKDYRKAFFALSKSLRRKNNVVFKRVGVDSAYNVAQKFAIPQIGKFDADELNKMSVELWKKG